MRWLVVAAALGACKTSSKASEAEVRLVQLATNKLAFEAYPQWAAQHPDKACPDKIEDLLALVDATDRNDPWGHSYVMLCGSSVPAGVRGLGVLSLGPDGQQGTTDDIKSWDP